jgi:hypothetical protein
VLLLQEQHVAGIPDTCILDIVAIAPSDELTSSYSEHRERLGDCRRRKAGEFVSDREIKGHGPDMTWEFYRDWQRRSSRKSLNRMLMRSGESLGTEII